MTTSTPAPSSVAASRALAPDLARGLMLMFIAAANIPWYLWGSSHANSLSHPSDGSALDRGAQFLTMLIADQRTYPMFAFLLGYGMVQLAESRRARGLSERQVRGQLRRRHWLLIAFGLVHAALLFEGDILGTYGLAGLLLVWIFFNRTNKTLVVWSAILGGFAALAVVFAVLGALAITFIPEARAGAAGSGGVVIQSAAGIGNYLASIPARLLTWLPTTVMQFIFPVMPVCILLGWLAARHRVLAEPEHHLPLLRRVAVAGVSIGLVGGLLNGLGHLGVIGTPPEVWWAFYAVAGVTGLAGGIGYICVFGLLAHRLRGSNSWLVQLTTAVGKRSLSCYLAQSLVFAPVLAAWGLGVGGWLGSAGALVFAILTWLGIALGALALERAGRRGPAEVLLRRLMGSPQPAAS